MGYRLAILHFGSADGKVRFTLEKDEKSVDEEVNIEDQDQDKEEVPPALMLDGIKPLVVVHVEGYDLPAYEKNLGVLLLDSYIETATAYMYKHGWQFIQETSYPETGEPMRRIFEKDR